MSNSVIFLRLFCIHTNFTLILVHLVNFTTTLFGLVLGENIIRQPLTSFLSSLRLTAITIYVLTLASGFYGVHNLSKGLVRGTISLFLLTCLLTIVALSIHLRYNISLAYHVGERQINRKLIAELLSNSSDDLEHLKIQRRIDSIQCYYGCCGWESPSDWIVENRSHVPPSCCLTAELRGMAENKSITCNSTSKFFHHSSCKRVMNWYLMRIHQFTKYSCIVSFPLTVLTCWFSIVVIKATYLDVNTSYFFPNGWDIVVFLRGSRKCMIRLSKWLFDLIFGFFGPACSQTSRKDKTVSRD